MTQKSANYLYYTIKEITFNGFTAVNCPTGGDKNVDKFLFKQFRLDTKEDCEGVCYNNMLCDFYMYSSKTCYCGDLDVENPLKTSFTAKDIIVNWKNADSVSENEIFKTCISKMAPVKAPIVKVTEGKAVNQLLQKYINYAFRIQKIGKLSN